MVESRRLVCRFEHVLHGRNSTLMKHSKTGKTWLRCLICHAARQRKMRSKTKCRKKITSSSPVSSATST